MPWAGGGAGERRNNWNSIWGDENVLKLMVVMATQLQELTKNHWSSYLLKNNGKIYWHSSQELKWGKAGYKFTEKKKKIKIKPMPQRMDL